MGRWIIQTISKTNNSLVRTQPDLVKTKISAIIVSMLFMKKKIQSTEKDYWTLSLSQLLKYFEIHWVIYWFICNVALRWGYLLYSRWRAYFCLGILLSSFKVHKSARRSTFFNFVAILISKILMKSWNNSIFRDNVFLLERIYMWLYNAWSLSI